MRLGRDPNPSAGAVESRSVKTTGVGGNERGSDPAKEVEGRERHLLVDAEGLVLEARVHGARVPDRDGIRPLSGRARGRFARLPHLWVDAGYQGRGRRWVGEAMGLSVGAARKPPKPAPEKAAGVWARGWAREGKKIDRRRLVPPRGSRVLPRGRVVERTLAWICRNRRMPKGCGGLRATGEAFAYAAMTRLMTRLVARRLARAQEFPDRLWEGAFPEVRIQNPA